MTVYVTREGETTIVWGRNNTADPMTVTWKAYNGTATLGLDAQIPSEGSFVVPAFQYREFRYDIIQDRELEGDEVFYVDVFWDGKLVDNAIMVIEGDIGSGISILPGSDAGTIFIDGPGDRILEGGRGYDEIAYDSVRQDYLVSTKIQDTIEIVKPDGVDVLYSIERVEFSDGALIFDLESHNADFAYRMYTAAYFRTPDEGGFRFWADVMERPELGGDGDLSYDDKLVLANEFLKADEFIAVYGANPTDEHYVRLMYENVLGREFDQEGRDYWLGRMEEGAGRDEILTVFVDSLENLSNTAADREDGFWVL